MTERTDPIDRTPPRRTGLLATGGLLAALGASACCIVPLLLFSAGVSGAWIGNLTALEPHKPLFIALAAIVLGYGYWLAYRRPRACTDGTACARPLPGRLVRSALWIATALVVIALFWNEIAPVIAPVLLGL